ncbi:hypothetical protein FBR02_15390 [Anaerolineae bacterium CFX9]|nr:hypothetical protein [Anaerolineae bacterium CFX9]
MSETNYSFDKDLREAKAMADALVPYVHEDNLYGTVGGGGWFGMGAKMPALTIGALLMRLQRLRALENELTAEQRGQLSQAERKLESVQREWTRHYEDKLVQEAKSRLKAIEQWFEENRDDPRSAANAWLPEAHRRTVVQAIANVLPSEEIDKAIRRVDSGLRRWVEPADFIWSPALQPAYPQTMYWWLYSRPATKGKKKDNDE